MKTVYSLIFVIIILSSIAYAEVIYPELLQNGTATTFNPNNFSTPFFNFGLNGINYHEEIGFYVGGTGTTTDNLIAEYGHNMIFQKLINVSQYSSGVVNIGVAYNGSHYYFSTTSNPTTKLVFDRDGNNIRNITFGTPGLCSDVNLPDIDYEYPYFYIPCRDGATTYIYAYDVDGNPDHLNMTITSFYDVSNTIRSIQFHNGKLYTGNTATSVIGEYNLDGTQTGKSADVDAIGLSNANFIIGIASNGEDLFTTQGNNRGIRKLYNDNLTTVLWDTAMQTTGGFMRGFTRLDDKWYSIVDEAQTNNLIYEHYDNFTYTGNKYFIGNIANFTRGIGSKDGLLYVTDDLQNKVFSFNFTSRTLENSYNLRSISGGNTRNLRWDGSLWYVIDRAGPNISVYDSSFTWTGHQINRTGQSEGFGASGIFLDGDAIFINDLNNKTMYGYNKTTGDYLNIVINFSSTSIIDANDFYVDDTVLISNQVDTQNLQLNRKGKAHMIYFNYSAIAEELYPISMLPDVHIINRTHARWEFRATDWTGTSYAPTSGSINQNIPVTNNNTIYSAGKTNEAYNLSLLPQTRSIVGFPTQVWAPLNYRFFQNGWEYKMSFCSAERKPATPRALLSIGDDHFQYSEIGIDTSGKLRIHGHDPTIQSGYPALISQLNISDGNWHTIHFYFTASGGDNGDGYTTVILDNSEVLNFTSFGIASVQQNTIQHIGHSPNCNTSASANCNETGGNGHGFKGLIDDLNVWNFTLTDEERSDAYEIQSAGGSSCFDVNQTEIISEPSLSITPVFPPMSANLSFNDVPFNLSVNITSNCELFINLSSYGVQSIGSGSIATHSTNTLANGTFEYFYECETGGYYFNSSEILFYIDVPASIPEIPGNETSTGGATDLTPLVDVLVALFMILLAVTVIGLGKVFKSGITGVIGCFILILASGFVTKYSPSITISLVLLSLLLMNYFIQRGKMNEL